MLPLVLFCIQLSYENTYICIKHKKFSFSNLFHIFFSYSCLSVLRMLKICRAFIGRNNVLHAPAKTAIMRPSQGVNCPLFPVYSSIPQNNNNNNNKSNNNNDNNYNNDNNITSFYAPCTPNLSLFLCSLKILGPSFSRCQKKHFPSTHMGNQWRV